MGRLGRYFGPDAITRETGLVLDALTEFTANLDEECWSFCGCNKAQCRVHPANQLQTYTILGVVFNWREETYIIFYVVQKVK